ncbi:hypothetical protein BSZ35_12165 [Salinibacter sp. 10B]|uniref:hypothetical protein n=1 Tax=Salinibacter sp. 10B TaxID=1923971 RepID=UPI000CF48829|nr:hypothetical protein [Salinibacter sp. 10B]PQJ35250.1 hypothetical protein BSZ35_12165 [Salinibacter sp. 10B]
MGVAQNSEPKEEALALFEDYAPTIEEEEGPILYKRPVQGDLTGDGAPDVLVEFGIGGGGTAVLYKQVAIYLNTDDGMQVVGGFEPEYCPSIDRIEGGTVYVEQLEACALPHPETVATHQYVFDSGRLKRRP